VRKKQISLVRERRKQQVARRGMGKNSALRKRGDQGLWRGKFSREMGGS